MSFTHWVVHLHLIFGLTFRVWFDWLRRGPREREPPLPQIMTCTLPHWGDARANSPSGSAMEAPALSHRPCWSPIDPAQVSMFSWNSQPSIYSSFPPCPLYVGQIEDILYLHFSISALFVSIHSPWPMTHALQPPLTIPCTMIPYLLYVIHPTTMPGWVCFCLALRVVFVPLCI